MKLTLPLLLIGALTSCTDAPFDKADGVEKNATSVDAKPAKKQGRASDFAILAVSWQPAFCERRPNKPECKTQNQGSFEASHFTLHGLWPRGAYCGVDKVVERMDKDRAWNELEPLQLNSATRDELKRVMPGFKSSLQRHEWIKHGTCYGNADAEEYYADSLNMMRQLNSSELQKLFASKIGQRVSREEIRGALDVSFGRGAGLRARVKCKRDSNSNRQLINEITIALKGEITQSSKISDHMLAARPDNKEGCPGGIVDPVGLQ